MSFVIVPFAPGVIVMDLNIGILFFLAMSSMGAYSIILEAGHPTINMRCWDRCAAQRK